MPEAKRIGELRRKAFDEAIADIIGIKRTTFLSRLKAKEKLAKEFRTGSSVCSGCPSWWRSFSEIPLFLRQNGLPPQWEV